MVWGFFKKSDFRIQLCSVDKTAHRKLLFKKGQKKVRILPAKKETSLVFFF